MGSTLPAPIRWPRLVEWCARGYYRKSGEAASVFPSELGVRGTMRLPNRKEELARNKFSSSANLVKDFSIKPDKKYNRGSNFERDELHQNDGVKYVCSGAPTFGRTSIVSHKIWSRSARACSVYRTAKCAKRGVIADLAHEDAIQAIQETRRNGDAKRREFYCVEKVIELEALTALWRLGICACWGRHSILHLLADRR